MNKSQFFSSVKQKNYERLINLALNEYEKGNTLTITELAEKSNLSRATAYRYFPTQSELVSAIVERSLGPILQWHSDQQDPEKKICDFLAFAFPQMLKHEGALRAALQVSLQQWAEERFTQKKNKDKLIRGNRKEILNNILLPLKNELPEGLYCTVIYAISIIYGSEIFVVLKDIWHLDDEKITSLSQWMAKAIINQARLESLQLPA